MTYHIEQISSADISRIQRDLRLQDRYRNVAVENFISPGPAERWAIDRERNRYLYAIRQPGSSQLCTYHFFLTGVSYEIALPDKLGEQRHVVSINGRSGKACLAYRSVLPLMQEAFDVYGLYGRGPDSEGWPGCFRVELFLSLEGS